MKRKKSEIKRSRLLFLVVLSVLSAGLFSYISFYKGIKPQNLAEVSEQKAKTIYPTQYSDLHITENAKVSDPRFRNLTLFNKENLLANVIQKF